MFANIFLLWSAAVFVLVPANPLMQAIPIQTCPINCQQHVYRNAPTNTPFVLQQSTSNYNPYSQQRIVQNQTPPVQNNQIPSQNNPYNQLVVSKILSNPAVRNILDPNTKLYDQNGFEVQRNVNGISNTGAVPNVINNYIIVPPELLQDNANKVNNNTDRRSRKGRKQCEVDDRRKKSNSSGRSEGQRSRKQRKHKNRRRNEPGSCEIKKDIVKGEVGHNSSEITGDVTEQQDIETATLSSLDVDKKSTLEEIVLLQENKAENITNATPENQIEITNKTNSLTCQENNDTIKTMLDNYTKFAKHDKIAKEYKAKPKFEETQNAHIQQNITQPNAVQSNKIKQNNRAEKTRQRNQDIRLKLNATPRNPKEEALIRDFRRKFPAIPEEVVRSLMSSMKEELQKEQQVAPNFYYPGFPLTFDQFYRPQQPQPKSGRNGNRRRKNRRNQNKNHKDQQQQEKCDTTIELTPTLVETEHEIVPTTTTETVSIKQINSNTELKEETPPSELENMKEPEVPTEDKVVIELIQPKSSKLIDPNNNTDNIHELGKEDVVPTIFVNGIADDYFPDFKDDRRYVCEVYTLKTLHDDRYHYTTDKNIEIERLNKEKECERIADEEKSIGTPKPAPIEVNEKSLGTPPKPVPPVEEIEDTLPRPHKTIPVNDEEIQFRTPPTLELPDFETKQINKDFITDDAAKKHTDMNKVSSYSDFKTPQYNTMNKPAKARPEGIETVYAGSKVTKYGPAPDSEEFFALIEESEESDDNDYWSKSNSDKEHPYEYDETGDTAIVVAQSYPNDDW